MTDPVYAKLAAAQVCDLPDEAGVLNGGPSPNGWSRQGDAGTCPQKWAFHNLFGDPTLRDLTGPLHDPLVRGTLVHVGMEHYWTRKLVQTHGGEATGLLDPVAAIRAFADRADYRRNEAGGVPGWSEHVDLAQQAMRLYVQQAPHAHLVPEAVEYVVAMWFDDEGVEVGPPPDADRRLDLARARRYAELYLLGGPWLSTFRVDLLARLPDGRVALIDWKTAYRVNQTKRDGFLLAGQMLQYAHWGWSRKDQFPGGFAGVYVGFCDFTQVAKGDASRAFPLHGVGWQPAGVARFGRSVADRGQRIRDLLRSGRDVEDWPRAFVEQGPCTDRYGRCEYARWCGEGVPESVHRWKG